MHTVPVHSHATHADYSDASLSCRVEVLAWENQVWLPYASFKVVLRFSRHYDWRKSFFHHILLQNIVVELLPLRPAVWCHHRRLRLVGPRGANRLTLMGVFWCWGGALEAIKLWTKDNRSTKEFKLIVTSPRSVFWRTKCQENARASWCQNYFPSRQHLPILARRTPPILLNALSEFLHPRGGVDTPSNRISGFYWSSFHDKFFFIYLQGHGVNSHFHCADTLLAWPNDCQKLQKSILTPIRNKKKQVPRCTHVRPRSFRS